MKKIISLFLSFGLICSFAPSALAYNTSDINPADTLPQIVYDVPNDDGVIETQEIFHLDDGGTIPEYITSIDYWDADYLTDFQETIPNSIEEIDTEHERDDQLEALASNMYESESNNSSNTADIYTDNINMYGSISPVGDVDWYKVYWPVDGNVDFYLENIPVGCNYNLKVFSQPKSGGSLTLYRTAASTGSSQKLLAVPVTNDKNYYMNVYSSKGSSGSRYLLRAKVSPIGDTFEPNDSFNDAKTIYSSSTANGSIHKPTDVDYYKFSATNGVVKIRLTNIPSGKDYRFTVYNSSKSVIYDTPESGSKEKNTDIPVSNGTYYVKVYSQSGFAVGKNYSLILSHRSPLTKVTGTITPVIKRDGGDSAQSTPIANLPVKIVYTSGTSQTQNTITTVTTDSFGRFTASFSLPTNVKKLYVKIYPDDSTLSVQRLDKTLPTFLYEIPFNSANVSITVDNSLDDQMRATYSIWRHAKEGIALFKSISGNSTSKLTILCTGGSGTQTHYAASEDLIRIAGLSSYSNYYDRDVIFHEMGHWQMAHNGASPSGAGGSHSWDKPSNFATAYSEGWAHYFSCTLRNDSITRDYNSSGNWYGGNLSNGNIKESSTGTLHRRQDQNIYENNAKMEINPGSTMWNLSTKLSKTFRNLEAVTKNKSDSFIQYYDKFMNTVISSQKEAAWTIFNDFGVAFDMEVPDVSLNVSGYTASMSASDNVAVKKYEWYIDNVLKSSGNGASSSIDLSKYSLSPGMHTVECRVYDPEGLSNTPTSRPRIERFGSSSASFVISSSVSTTGNEDILEDDINASTSIHENLEQSSEAIISTPEQHVTYEIQKNYIAKLYPEIAEIESAKCQLLPGTSSEVTVDAPGNADLMLFFLSSNGVKEYRVIAPDGSEYDSFSNISPAKPYTISDAEPGTWTIEFDNFTQDDAHRILEEQGVHLSSEDGEIVVKPTTINITSGVSILTPEIDLPEDVNDPHILRQFKGTDVSIYSDGELLDTLDTLEDGVYELAFIKETSYGSSKPVYHYLNVDTTAPEIEVIDLPAKTERSKFVLLANFSEDISSLQVNGQEIDLGVCQRNALAECLELSPGENTFFVSFMDYAGNSNSVTLEVIMEAK